MCGIFAFFSRAQHIPGAVLQRATAALHHRGPDGQRCWTSSDGRVGLGHTRLSIIDLATGEQPIASEDERSRIIVNGEFYGYEAIQRELERSGHRLRTRSDSEIALHLYREQGPQCLHRLRGEFAFVVWDERTRTLFAARDRFGIKPLFYAFHQGTLYLASEAKALFAAGVPARWDADTVWQTAEYGGHQIRTLFDGVFQVPPGHYLLATDKHLQLIPYWDFDYPRLDAGAQECSDAEYAARVSVSLEEAVKLRLRADVPVGCYLSGGLDSCAVLGIAARHAAAPIRAFTLSFDRDDYNEEAYAKEMANRAGAEFMTIPIRQDDLADHFAAAIEHAELLATNAHGVAKYVLSRAVRDAGCKVVLTGEGADEIFGGYAHFRRDMLLDDAAAESRATRAAQLQELETANPVSRGLFLPHGEAGVLALVRRLLGFVPSWIETFSARTALLCSVLADDFSKHFVQREPYFQLLADMDVRRQLAGRARLHQSMYLWSKTVLPNYLLAMLGDRMEMAHSVEGRPPFLDHHVVETVRALPMHCKIRGMTEKYVLREAVRALIPETVYRRQKHPFLSPPVSLDRGGRFHALVQDTLRSSAMGAVPFFDPRRVVRFLDSLPAMDESTRVAVDGVLMNLLSACVLQERFQLAIGDLP
jgi:asparagine synthase (glutamine-hydrolysing)